MPVATIDDALAELAAAARRLDALGALEGAAGNISLLLPHALGGLEPFLRERMPAARPFALPAGVRLPAGVLLITGTGRRLRELATCPEAVLCALVVDTAGGCTLHRAPAHAVEPTSELDSHAGIHAAAVPDGPRGEPHAVIHAQPPKLTFLSHLPAYRDDARLNRQLYRWQPETLVMLPEGVRVLPFEVPGTPAQGQATTAALRAARVVVWAKHGVVARSPRGALAATDLIDYLEAAARYEVDDLHAGRPADGLTLAELRGIAARFGVSGALLERLPEGLLAR